MGIRSIAGIACAVSAALGIGGCGGAGSPTASGPVVNVRERDFHIVAPAHVAAGVVTFRSHNAGPDTHELLVVRSTSDHLPLRADGLTVDEDAIKHLTAGTIEGVAPGHDGESRIRLAPGHYELLCNMAGHYRGGMQADLVVS